MDARHRSVVGILTLLLGVGAAAAHFHTETSKLPPVPGAAPYQYFGSSVALLGDTAVIGEYCRPPGGAACVFRSDGSSWPHQPPILQPYDGAAGDQFGNHIAISGDAMVIGAYFDDDNGGSSGSAYVYRFKDLAWHFEQKLLPKDGATGDQFGTSVAISGNTVAIGASQADDVRGAAYVFVYDQVAKQWNQKAELLASDRAAHDWFGVAVAMFEGTVVVGAQGSDANGPGSGSAYVFGEPSSGWDSVPESEPIFYGGAILRPWDSEAGQCLGNYVAMDGNTVVVASYNDNDNGYASGSAYVFEKPVGGWPPAVPTAPAAPAEYINTAKLRPSDGKEWDWFGWSAAISGNTIVVGAIQFYNDGPGAAYVFDQPCGGWSAVPSPICETTILRASDGEPGDDFGNAVAIDARTVIVSAFKGNRTGLAYVFELGSPPDTEAPVVTCSVSLQLLDRLWPPNHDLANVGLNVTVTDNCDVGLTPTVLIYGDEDDEESTGDGQHSPDAKDIAPGTLRLCSERKGDADGRVYLIVVEATDSSGNVGRACCTVVVPLGMSQSNVDAVQTQADAARAFYEAYALPPADYFIVGDGVVIGPKQ